ncbi:MAG: CHASE2 domain-containing protein [Alphaproteobacteria bacterium]
MADEPNPRHVGELAAMRTPAGEPPRRVQLASIAALIVLVALVFLRALDIDPFARLRLLGFDAMQRLVSGPAASGASEVVIIDIDDRSLAAIGQWPWPRDVLADLVAALDRRGVRLIAFDILFAEPDRSAVGEGRGTDAALAAAIVGSGSPVVLASALLRAGGRTGADRLILPPSLALDGSSPIDWVPVSDGLVGNVPELEAAAAGRGFLSTISDRDGLIRRLPLLAHVGGNLQTGLVLEASRLAGGESVATVRTHPLFGVAGIDVGGRFIATDSTGALWLHGRSWTGPIGRVSVVDVLSGSAGSEALSGRIALIGSTAAGVGDVAPLPSGTMRSGVEVLAAGIENALSDDPLVRPGYMRWLEMLAALVVGLVLVYRMSLYTAMRTAVWAGIVVTVTAGVAILLLAFGHLLFDPTFPILATVAMAGFVGYGRSREVERSRAQARRSLAETAAFIHRLVDATFDSVIAVDGNGRLLFANQAARALPILGVQATVGTDVLALLRRADQPADSGRLQAADMAAGEGTFDLVAAAASGDEPIRLEATATALQGEPSGAIVLVMRDVTARRVAQRRIEAQTRALESLAEDLKQQTEAALSARAAADSANAAKSEFLMMMSHELRTPLNAVMGFAELMLSEPFGPLGDRRYQAYLQDIRTSGGQLLAMIDSILEVIRLDRLEVAADDESFALAQVIDSCCAAMEAEAAMKSVALLHSVDENALGFRGDVGLMRHILGSVLSNAIKFTEPGGRVSVSVHGAGGRGLTIEVADTGIGMSQTQLDRAVVMLEHSGSSMTRSHGGVGVGLALAKLATDKQGGELKIASAPGRGTTVQILFPESRLVRPTPRSTAGAAPYPRLGRSTPSRTATSAGPWR